MQSSMHAPAVVVIMSGNKGSLVTWDHFRLGVAWGRMTKHPPLQSSHCCRGCHHGVLWRADSSRAAHRQQRPESMTACCPMRSGAGRTTQRPQRQPPSSWLPWMLASYAATTSRHYRHRTRAPRRLRWARLRTRRPRHASTPSRRPLQQRKLATNTPPQYHCHQRISRAPLVLCRALWRLDSVFMPRRRLRGGDAAPPRRVRALYPAWERHGGRDGGVVVMKVY